MAVFEITSMDSNYTTEVMLTTSISTMTKNDTTTS